MPVVIDEKKHEWLELLFNLAVTPDMIGKTFALQELKVRDRIPPQNDELLVVGMHEMSLFYLVEVSSGHECKPIICEKQVKAHVSCHAVDCKHNFETKCQHKMPDVRLYKGKNCPIQHHTCYSFEINSITSIIKAHIAAADDWSSLNLLTATEIGEGLKQHGYEFSPNTIGKVLKSMGVPQLKTVRRGKQGRYYNVKFLK